MKTPTSGEDWNSYSTEGCWGQLCEQPEWETHSKVIPKFQTFINENKRDVLFWKTNFWDYSLHSTRQSIKATKNSYKINTKYILKQLYWDIKNIFEIIDLTFVR